MLTRRILFCSDPLNISQVDPSYAAEATAAAAAAPLRSEGTRIA